MAKVKIYANKALVVSSIDADNLEKVEKYRPSELKLFDKDDNETFAVKVSKAGSISEYGVGFDTKTVDGKAATWIDIPDKTENAKDYIIEKIRKAFPSLNTIEEGIAASLDSINAEIEAIGASVEVAE
jgi:hypothetical protein